VRLAGNEELYSALSDQPEADEPTSKLDIFLQTYELLREKGLGDKAAEYYAEEMVNGREPMATLTPRFAGIYGDPIKVDRASRSSDRGI
jgi:hypothetical protein